MMRTVHCPQIIFHSFKIHWREHAILVVRKVTAGKVHTLFSDMRSNHSFVTSVPLRFLGQFFQLLYDDAAIGHPQNQSGTDVIIKGENAKFFSEFSMVS